MQELQLVEIQEPFIMPPYTYNRYCYWEKLSKGSHLIEEAPYVTRLETELRNFVAELREQKVEKKCFNSEQNVATLIRTHIKYVNIPGAEEMINSAKSSSAISHREMEQVRMQELRLNIIKKILAQCNVLQEWQQYKKLLKLATQGLTLSEGNLELSILRAEALWNLEPEARSDAEAIRDACVVSAFTRGLALFDEDDIDGSIRCLKFAYKLAPCLTIDMFRTRLVHLRSMREQAFFYYDAGDYANAKVNFRACTMYIIALNYPNTATEANIAKIVDDIDEKLTLLKV